MSRPHRHIREANKAKSEAKASLVAYNVANPPTVHLAGVRADGKSQSLGFRSSPSVKQSHQIRIHFTPFGGNSSPDSSLTSKQRQVKYRHQPLTCGAK